MLKKPIKFKELPYDIKKDSLTASVYNKASYPDKGITISKSFLVENKKTDTQAYVFRDENRIIIVFRGTQKKFRDIFTDLWAFKKHIPYNHKGKIRVHAGFLNAYMSVRKEILFRTKVLKEAGCDSVIVCGHSLGGALATPCALDIQYNKIFDSDHIYGYTDGQPKFGNKHFAKSFDKRIPNYYRCTNWLDFVPIVPLSAKHIGKKIRTKNLKYHNINNYIHNKATNI